MARRGANRRTKATEPAVIAQANPTPEQRARYAYAEAKTVDPFGQTVVQGKIKQHPVCRKEPVYVTLHRRRVIDDDERRALDWYDARLGLARKGLTADSLGKLNGRGGSGDCTPTEAAIEARESVRWARAHIKEGGLVFDAVMEHEMSLTEIAGPGGAGKTRARVAFQEAAGWLTRGVWHRLSR